MQKTEKQYHEEYGADCTASQAVEFARKLIRIGQPQKATHVLNGYCRMHDYDSLSHKQRVGRLNSAGFFYKGNQWEEQS